MSKLSQLLNVMAAAVRSIDNTSEVESLIRQSGDLTNKDRLSIYRGSINASFINTLKSSFPVCHSLVGRKFFSAMCCEYLQTTTSTSPDLNDFGVDFPNFIAEFPHAQAMPYLSDVAQLEWYWHRVSLIAESRPVNLQPLTELSEDQLADVTFALPDGAYLFSSNYPVQDIWAANVQEDNPITEIDSSTPGKHFLDDEKANDAESDDRFEEIDLDSGGVNLIIFRDDSGRRMDQLSDQIFFMLSHFTNDRTFGETAEHFVARYSTDNFSTTFAICCQQGWINLNIS